TADSTSVCSTDLRSKVERLIILSTSAVAVCCRRDSLSSSVRACTSSNSRTFSIAITAWSANVVTSSICLLVNGSGTLSCHHDHPDGISIPQQWDAKHRAVAGNLLPLVPGIFRIGQHVGNVDHPSLENRACIGGAAARRHGMCL